jgi:AcrR family transcriptional regulator
MPRPRSLTPATIGAAALAVIDRDGLAALSMRAVAAELGMAPMSLYRYVDDRGQMEALAVDLLLADVDTAPPHPAPWTRQAAVLVERARDAVAAHPAAVPLTLTHRHASHSLLRWSESMLDVLTRAGFTGEERAFALRSLLAYLIGSIQLDHLGPLAGQGTATMAALPSDELPLLRETAGSAQGISGTDEFRRGLALLLHGLDRARGSDVTSTEARGSSL